MLSLHNIEAHGKVEAEPPRRAVAVPRDQHGKMASRTQSKPLEVRISQLKVSVRSGRLHLDATVKGAKVPR